MFIKLPRVFSLDLQIAGNSVRQLGEPSYRAEGTISTFSFGRREEGFIFQPNAGDRNVVIVKKATALPETGERILQAAIDAQTLEIDLSTASWLRHPLLERDNSRPDREMHAQETLCTWSDSFTYLEESRPSGVIGLRPPQLGALHAIRSHWFLENSTATIVLPTGTGKTETMLATLVSVPCSKILVIVPTDSLREQLALKFTTLGILKLPGSRVLKETAKCPIVCMLRHIPTIDTVNDICAVSNVIVTTSSIAAQCSAEVQSRLAGLCPYLFIDEAHHAEAPTWKKFKEAFAGRRILQFTATPFREDGEPLDGKIIFKYPLRKAQEEEYFRPIRFEPVIEFDRRRADIAIAQCAIARLRQEAIRGHILMARVDSVSRAKEVFAIYEQYAEFNPVQLHTGIKSVQKRAEIRRQLLSGHTKIVVCVDMLGEGFDLPELKIAAFHDIRKSLAVTLQLAGRFTRARPDLGDATFIANTADVNVRHELRKLYSRDPDWNVLLPQLSDQLVTEQVSLQEFLSGFTPLVQSIPVRCIRPATSTVVYKTNCRAWTPENFREGIPAFDSCAQVHETVNQSKHTLVVVTARQVGLEPVLNFLQN
jgi:superfamily II DNA or RNA helicase